MMLADLNDEIKDSAALLGKHVALALQAYTELQPFLENNSLGIGSSTVMDLSAAPILFHLQNDKDLLNYIQTCGNNIENLNSKQVWFGVCTLCLKLLI